MKCSRDNVTRHPAVRLPYSRFIVVGRPLAGNAGIGILVVANQPGGRLLDLFQRTGVAVAIALPGNDIPLQHLATRSFANGLVQSHYRVLPAV